ncbi:MULTISPECIES: 2-oxo-4-hydroxy-4-carboxy-5-ureidoimidazoline decarboxylase [unclassified Vibrio]|uniref:2-oxo-4-hydroxy-4-carboxy-5-ureidoimidazoline decarboxylase n=1 Tax=Vibrio sp. HB236076 TaxID=3232307 RepID=A0AB39HL16_9VIBR|nr:2-oxo-4-hydroxy-4-carboxy-5-ureidoimidazoline decarboxylase [Vibrio sp. HB161653]MDP5252843.1 2-oxo-4-hydroxy-4-carboxy-5-ureidoimidazoline decarboxylase [Vibrio sp. HB161653]
MTIHIDPLQWPQLCSSVRWQTLMQAQAPFESEYAFKQAASASFAKLNESDWLEAFAGHPMIGDIESLAKKYGHGKALSEKEQAQVSGAEREVLESLLVDNQTYRDKFGFIFIIFASDKTAEQMLKALRDRINNRREQELENASQEQMKITLNRMEALL